MLSLLINWYHGWVNCIQINFLEYWMPLTLSILFIRNFLNKISWTMLVRKNTRVDWKNTLVNNVVKALLEHIEWEAWGNGLFSIRCFNWFDNRTIIFVRFLPHFKITKWRLLFWIRCLNLLGIFHTKILKRASSLLSFWLIFISSSLRILVIKWL